MVKEGPKKKTEDVKNVDFGGKKLGNYVKFRYFNIKYSVFL